MIKVLNLLDMLRLFGEDSVKSYLSEFSTTVDKDGKTRNLNPDIESFLKINSIQFAKERKSITYVVGESQSGALLGFFSLTHKTIDIPALGLSKTTIKRLEKHSKLNKNTNSYLVSAFLIAQFGKNYSIDKEMQISGGELMKLCYDELSEIRYRIGGNVIYLDCEADARLIRFYQEQQKFTLFGERISEGDGKRYLQYMKFL